MAATETHVVCLIIAFELKNSVLWILANTCTLAWPETSVQVGVCPVTVWSSVPPAWRKQQKMDIASLISQNGFGSLLVFVIEDAK